MRCQRCGFEIAEGTVDCQQCDKRQVVKSSSLPTSVSYFLCVAANAIGLILALLIFKEVSDPFEVIVISALTIIYLTVKSSAGRNTLSVAEFAKLVLSKLHPEKKATSEDVEAEYVHVQHTRARVKMYINGAFDAALYAVALFNLIAALYSK